MTDGLAIDEGAELRGRLIAMRAELVERLARDGIEGAALALVAGLGAAIEAIEAGAPGHAVPQAAAEPPAAVTIAGGRAVLSDDGEAIRLALYGEAGVAAAVTLAPLRAAALAGELIAAALPRLRAR